MKKFLLTLIALIFAISAFAGCGESDDAVAEGAEKAASEQAVVNTDDAEEKNTASDKKEDEEPEKPEPVVEGQGEYEQISQDEAKAIIDDEEPAVVLDVRTYDEYDAGHIDGALCIPVESMNETSRAVMEQLIPRKDQTILVYDEEPERSKKAAQFLADIGYTSVKEFGDVNEWKYGTVTE